MQKEIELPAADLLYFDPDSSLIDLFDVFFREERGKNLDLCERASELLLDILEPNPEQRASAEESLNCPFLSSSLDLRGL